MKRYIEAQEHIFEIAKAEIIEEQKRSHWMWFIFPQILLYTKSTNPQSIFGYIDALKLCSSMTLFYEIAPTPQNQIFEAVLQKFFYGQKCTKTLKILNKQFVETNIVEKFF